MRSKSIVICVMLLAAATSYGSIGEYALDAGTVALWHMNEGTGTSTADASGNNHYASFNGSPYSPTWTGGLHGAAGIHIAQDRFPGDSNSSFGSGLVINNGNLFDLPTFTLQMHVKWDGGSGFVIPGDNYAGHLVRDFYGMSIRMHAYNSTEYYMKFLNNCNTGWKELTYHETLVPGSDPDSGRLDAGTWYELTVVRELQGNGTTDAEIWIDGTKRVEMNFSGTPWGGTGAGFGHVQSSSNFTFPCELDEARLLNYAIPEPATLALLSLGGLFLRRRK